MNKTPSNKSSLPLPTRLALAGILALFLRVGQSWPNKTLLHSKNRYGITGRGADSNTFAPQCRVNPQAKQTKSTPSSARWGLIFWRALVASLKKSPRVCAVIINRRPEHPVLQQSKNYEFFHSFPSSFGLSGVGSFRCGYQYCQGV
jgi:hypothetical protein